MAGRCVRVEPPFVEFKDVKVGEVYRKAVTVTNIGKQPKKIFIEKPNSKLFNFIQLSQSGFVPSGFSVRGVLEFTPDAEEEVRDSIRVHIADEEILQVPVTGFPRSCSFTMDSVLDFGCIVARGQMVSKLHPITNVGSAPGVFQVEYSGGDASLSFSPSSGVIAAGTTQWLKVELHTVKPGQIDEKALVKLEKSSTVVLHIRAEVVEQHLEVSDLQGSPLSFLCFGPVYFGTSCVQNVLLRNNAPLACDWVCLLQDNPAGTEAGTDFLKSTQCTLLERMKNSSSPSHALSEVLECFPTHGRLGPYDKTTVAVRFSPICRSRRKCVTAASRQDYCLFLLFDIVDCKHGFTQHTADSSVEVSVTGSGVPVALLPSPSTAFDFPSCAMGQHSGLICVLQNLCPQLPVRFRFRKLAHFTADPTEGSIAPGRCQDIILTFIGRQQGSFQVRQKVDVLGWVASQKDSSSTKLSCFHTISLSLSATCYSVMPLPKPKPLPALNSLTGTEPPITLSELARRSLLARAPASKLHKHGKQRSEGSDGDEFQASSIIPASQLRQYRTIFTRAPLYYHVDTSYAFTEEEEQQRQCHRQTYMTFIQQLRQKRLQKIREREQDTLKDGLVPPKLHIRDLESTDRSEGKLNDTTKCTGISEAAVKTVPSTSQQVADCSRKLTPYELYQVVICPLKVDFGSVCLESVCVQELHLFNRLPLNVWVELKMNCPELQGSSLLSQVLPPFSHSSLPLTFESSQLGPFHRSLNYTVNQQHPGQILVQAQVVSLSLVMSTNLLVLPSTPLMFPGSEYRSTVTLHNPCNCAADFTWQPVIPESGLLLFSVRPATGTVEPHMELDCEVVWHPSFDSPSEGDFDLCVPGGKTQRLHCVAKIGTTTVQLVEQRILFRSVPLNTTSIRTAVLHNSGWNHAYYQVVDPSPLPGMVLSPSQGVVPSRGQAILYIQFNPDCVSRFDTKFEIALRNMKSTQLRVGGSVEPPNIEFSVSHFQFCGVHVGSQQEIPFTLTNHSAVTSRLTFDLSEYKDFSVQVCQPSAKAEKEPGVTVVQVSDGQTQECLLVFSPTQVISYDFFLPLTVNGLKWPSSLSPSLPPVWIQATALFAPVEMSPPTLQFVVQSQSNILSQTVELTAEQEQSVCWRAITGEGVNWWFDLSATDAAANKLCVVTPSSGFLRPGQSVCVGVSIDPEAIRMGEKGTVLYFPLYLGEKETEGRQRNKAPQPYRKLSVIIRLPRITFHPCQILLTPVPLRTRIETTLTLQTTGYPCGTAISARVDEIEMEDGTKIQLVSVAFPDGNVIPAQDCNQKADVTSLLCKVAFCSAVPVSLCTTITFSDHMDNRFKIELCAVADNCLLTVWPYMALNRSDPQIVLKTGATAVEAVLKSVHTSSSASGLITSSTFSLFDPNSSTCSTDSVSYSTSLSEQASRNTNITPTRDAPSRLSLPKFPDSNSEEGLYYEHVLLATERWFSLFGWPGGPHPMSIPHTLRRVSVKTNPSIGRRGSVSRNKDTRSVVDMLHHLTGRRIPGIPQCQTFSDDIHQRTTQLLQQHRAILAFLRVQGAFLCHIRPEYLLDTLEFKHWCSLQAKDTENGLDCNFVDYECLSKQSWTDVLLQIYKVLVLRCVPEEGLNTPLNPRESNEFLLDGSQPLVSTVYSPQELHLLSWLNRNYQRMRKTVWERDGVPVSRWIVNFDLDFTDGLVLAALMAAHCPYLISSHFRRMYTSPSSLQQILHNNIIVVQALTVLGLNIGIKPTDLCDANPVQILLLCVHLYETLSHYLPSETLTLTGALHGSFSKQLHLRNPSSRSLRYKVLLLGKDAPFFSVPGGSMVTIPTKSSIELTVQVSCSFLHPMEAVLLLVPSSSAGFHCSALAFNLKTRVSQIKPTHVVHCSSPCYQLKTIEVPVTNTFNKEAHFRVVLVETAFNPLDPKKREDLLAQLDVSANRKSMISEMIDGEETEDGEASEFLSTEKSVFLQPDQRHTLSILYLPFYTGTKYCSVLLLSPQVGDMMFVVKATSEILLPSPLPASSTPGRSDGCALRLKCKVGEVCEAVLQVPLVNVFLEEALAAWAQRCMSTSEHRRRLLMRSLHSSTVRAATATQKLLQQSLMRSVNYNEVIKYEVDVSMPQYFSLPQTVSIPIKEDARVPWETSADCGCVDVPLRFQAHSVGRFACRVLLTSCFDIRVYQLEAIVTQQDEPLHGITHPQLSEQ
ncbi:PREDICTED: cilia- and flagella-associated protein 47 [Cyprinodon variegatus]|uniref:cilia- and flagella-associated protein 47 n=1 Tax=Cyprinodon variegatus TaxID=28743 RepID=UPI000742C1BF|nr:PREDICTED: cilia- and flagella-associated protein 47 [Cyprinodon variegatus]